MKLPEMQKKWDSCLIRGWIEMASMYGVTIWFHEQVNPHLIGKQKTGRFKGSSIVEDGVAAYEFLMDSGLKRCADYYPDEICINWGKMPARAFISFRSPKMANALWDGAFEFDVLANIDKYPWRLPACDKEKRNRKQRRRNEKRCTVFIKARKLSGNHDWDKVK